MDKEKKQSITEIPSAMRAGMKAKIAKRMKIDPQFRKKVEGMIAKANENKVKK